MPRSKKTTSRGRANGGVRSRRNPPTSLRTSFVPYQEVHVLEHARNDDAHGFSLRSEALNTQRHQPSSESNRQLRHSKINFISAGDFNPSKLTDSETAMSNMSLEESPNKSQGSDALQLEIAKASNEIGPNLSIVSDQFIIDTQGSKPISTGLPSPQVRPISPVSSNSSDEVIVFSGRDGPSIMTTVTPKGVLRGPSPYNAQIKGSDDSGQEPQCPPVITGLSESLPPKTPETLQTTLSSHCLKTPGRTSAGNSHSMNESMAMLTSQRQNRQRKSWEKSQEDAVIRDYITNMEANDLDFPQCYNQRDLGGSDDETWRRGTTPPTELHFEDIPRTYDSGHRSTPGDVRDAAQAIISKRIEKEGGAQYLVVLAGQIAGEARWIPQSNLTDPFSMLLIERFEADGGVMDEVSDGDYDSSGSISENKLIADDEADPTNDSIVGLFAKQEGLDMGSGGLIMFDDGSAETEDNSQGEQSHDPPRMNQSQSKAAKRPRGEFPSAALLADAYDGFDIMDFERPSLKKKSKSRKGKPAFDLSDSELENSLQLSWEKDRERKRWKKGERENLRVQGLLGQKRNKADLKAKYKEGMGIHAVKEEIRNFLKSDDTTLALPPMTKAHRKLVHEFANALNLKSKSAGSGQKRFPILFRTSKTSAYVDGAFETIESRLEKRFLPRMDLKVKGVTTRKQADRGSSGPGVSYRDGDIVGASAPEIGIENKGRAMLEKMGWSTGTGLGALNNRGILQPVSHVVKTSKAGLG